jgi:hypothetical protein
LPVVELEGMKLSVGISNDITERLEAEQKLLKVNLTVFISQINQVIVQVLLMKKCF